MTDSRTLPPRVERPLERDKHDLVWVEDYGPVLRSDWDAMRARRDALLDRLAAKSASEPVLTHRTGGLPKE